ncbi:hypothetical protein G4B88_027521 [Cannabis sativa]|uniref:FAD-binding PCMH-type domain-containing protein n=1 Tax=Cannabis sativa TaxID=3483 RepID=A0A7J6G637_CANSA|nr:hypothetical protein G4B88_027521 [Cannabis sativa]
MKYSTFSFWFLCKILVSLLSFSIQTSRANPHDNFLQCFSKHINNNNNKSIVKVIHTPNDPSYISVLNSTIQNLRFASPSTPKPLVIITPSNTSHVQACVLCSKKYGLQIRTRSGGHDFEGASYVSKVPFVILDMRNLRSITVDVDTKTAWVEAGATIGELYYRIAEKNGNLSFPAGYCRTVGVGGHFSGGGYGALLRKYGLAADNIIDAHLVNADGEFLDRKSMGEDLFWAIRGGGGASFGIILAWKIRLVAVPSKVTMFSVSKNLEMNETVKIYNKWQNTAYKFDKDLLLFVSFMTINSTDSQGKYKTTIQASFSSIFLGRVESLLILMQKKFPELGIERKDCLEKSWIETVVYFDGFSSGDTPESLLNTTFQQNVFFKVKLDYVKKPVPEVVMVKLLEKLYEEDVGVGFLMMYPYGGKMDEISESAIPFPHRAGFMYKILYLSAWEKEGESEKHMNWVRSAYNFMSPYVSQNPRATYLNYRDLDLGTNNEKGPISYSQASVWGKKYFGMNFKRLVNVKTKVDPNPDSDPSPGPRPAPDLGPPLDPGLDTSSYSNLGLGTWTLTRPRTSDPKPDLASDLDLAPDPDLAPNPGPTPNLGQTPDPVPSLNPSQPQTPAQPSP